MASSPIGPLRALYADVVLPRLAARFGSRWPFRADLTTSRGKDEE